jgi:DNA gyrase/topoisomerase IV subunit A
MADRDDVIKHLRTEVNALGSRLGDQNRLLGSLRAQLQAHETATGDERRTQIFRRAAIDMVP